MSDINDTFLGVLLASLVMNCLFSELYDFAYDSHNDYFSHGVMDESYQYTPLIMDQSFQYTPLIKASWISRIIARL